MSDIDYSFGDHDDSPQSGDNRSEYRLTASARVTIELETPGPEEAAEGVPRTLVSRTSDLSAKGIRLSTQEPLTEGALLPVRISLEGFAEPFQLMTEVVWCRSSSQASWLVGLQIMESDQTSYLEWVEGVARAMSEG